ncbi:NAD(P)H-hydrate epimerase [Blastopirellula marina]|uniref:NAD(P)H-hydrate epimerase n=1 Tax=Blastopirellula marina TaxID=124 RepID=A0A2S8G920_9BACT|nr:NAD(P)H-hydrate epimerase [Blastopirellula marina]PQO40923.1 NAD(P)H-hydrate epimerase [Blastopirellula marina]PTL45805.1 NAD(P)H-hydrate epimerase [Blastopirellula marina]
MSTRPPLSREQSRAVDQLAAEKYHIPGVILMENAGRGCAELLNAQAPKQVLIACGPGNNGGDGYVIARHLDLAGVGVKIALFCPRERIQGDALINFRIVEASGLEIIDCSAEPLSANFTAALGEADWVVDALLGTGVTSAPREPIASAIRAINASPAGTLAIDIPSGLDCDTGQPHNPTIEANLTATFVTPKPGYEQETAKPFVGELHVIDIGTPRKLLAEVLGAAD